MEYSIKTVKVAEKDIELLKMSSIQSQFPVKFKEGMTYTNFEIGCAECDEKIQNEDLRGSVTHVLENMAQVEARGFCRKCNLVTPASYRLYADGRFMCIQDGKWTTYHMKKKIPFWRKILKFLFW